MTRLGPDRSVVFRKVDQFFIWRTVMGNMAFAHEAGSLRARPGRLDDLLFRL